jgi:hypothetical protein
MPLNDLSLEELSELSGTLVTLETVGRDLAEQGLAPRFDLTPGEAVTITTRFRMPAIESPKLSIDDVFRAHVARTDSFDDHATDALIREALSIDTTSEPAAPSRSGDEAPPPPGVAEAALPLAEAASSEGAADSGGGQQLAAAMPPAAPAANEAAPVPIPGSASAMAAGPGGSFASPPWTPEEDDRLVALVAMGVTRLKLQKLVAINAAADELGRGREGVKSRCYNKLKDRLDAAIAQPAPAPEPGGDAFLDQPEDTPSPDAAALDAISEAVANRPDFIVADGTEATLPPDLDARSRDTAIAHGTHPEPASFAADPVTAHLMALPDKGGWTLERDHELMELSNAGWQLQEIALQLQVQADLVKKRFDLLTGLTEDAAGKKVRRFTREAVMTALDTLKTRSAA